MYAGQYEDAVRVLRRTPTWESQPYTWNLTASLVALNRLDEALAARDTAEAAQPNNPYGRATRALILAMSGDVEAARATMDGLPRELYQRDVWRSYIASIIRVLSGELDDWDQRSEQLDEILIEVDDPSGRLHLGLSRPWVTSWVGEDPVRAAQELEAHLERMDLPSPVSVQPQLPGDRSHVRDAGGREWSERNDRPLP